MISAFYAALSAVIIFWLSLNVIKIRRKHRVSVGDGENAELKTAMAAQSNAVEYIPITLLLIYALEYNGANLLFIHLAGILLIIGRMVHARGLLGETLRIRVLGMKITLYTLLALVVLNLVYLPYDEFLSF